MKILAVIVFVIISILLTIWLIGEAAKDMIEGGGD